MPQGLVALIVALFFIVGAFVTTMAVEKCGPGTLLVRDQLSLLITDVCE